jgi:hypothetical protein
MELQSAVSRWVLKIVVMTRQEVNQSGLGKPLQWKDFPAKAGGVVFPM